MPEVAGVYGAERGAYLLRVGVESHLTPRLCVRQAGFQNPGPTPDRIV